VSFARPISPSRAPSHLTLNTIASSAVRLVAIEVKGFRRFATKQKLETDGLLTAVVGPNEAGKTTLLEAIQRLEDRAPVEIADRTRKAIVSDEDVVLEALWLVEPEDRARIKDLPGMGDDSVARWLIVKKRADGALRMEVRNALRRDRRRRAQAARAVAALFRRGIWSAEGIDPSDIRHPDQLESNLDPLLEDVETIDTDDLDRLVSLADVLESTGDSKLARTITALRAADEAERSEHPNETAQQSLWRRTPDFLLFDDDQRALTSDYDLNAIAADPPPALSNLAQLAGLDLENLLQLITTDESGTIVEVLEDANLRLREAFRAWSQEEISVHFDRGDGALLRLHVANPAGGYTKLDERSDGLKIFVALLAVTARKRGTVPPIVLIDELERHLHYDAQADVVQVFSRQEALNQIIYTTHSAGCLPEDLGKCA
jgi:predicted ATP-dependent endonuclease of OLD family